MPNKVRAVQIIPIRAALVKRGATRTYCGFDGLKVIEWPAMDPLLDELVAKAAGRFAFPICAVLDLDGPGAVRAAFGLPPEIPQEALYPIREILASADQAGATADCCAHPLLKAGALFKRHGIQALAGASAGRKGARRGLCLLDPRPHEVSKEELRLLSLLCALAAERLDREPRPSGRPPAVDPLTGAYSNEFLTSLCEAELACGAETSLILIEADRLPDIRKSHGREVSDRLMVKLADALRAQCRVADSIGRRSQDALEILLPRTGAAALDVFVARLRERLREHFRFPVSLGAAALPPPFKKKGMAEALRRAATEALEQVRGKPSAPARMAGPPQPAAGAGATLAERYQKLILLHRISLELFSSGIFEVGLANSGHTILALANAKHLRIYQRLEMGDLAELHAQGDSRFEAPQAREAVRNLLARAFSGGDPAWSAEGEFGWLAVPIPGPTAFSKPQGTLLLGFLNGAEPDREARKSLEEVALLLGNTFTAQRQLREQKMLAAVTEQSADALILSDLEDRVTSWSRGAQELFGFSPEETLGRRIEDFFVPPGQLEQHRLLRAQASKEGKVIGVESLRLSRDGRLVPVEMTQSLVQDDHGRPFAVVNILRDITKRKEVERMKSEFVTLVSHELRTPLTSIRGFADTLGDYWETLPPDQIRHYLRIILDEANRLTRLVTDFLDVSRLEAGGVKLDLKPLRLRAVAEKVAETFKANSHDVSFDLDVDAGLPAVRADEDQVHRVLVNLCGNALKYSPKGGVIRLAGALEGQDLLVTVSDQGPGISPENQKQLFQRFYRANDPIAMKTSGTGLGLSIAKSIVEMHGGRIWSESAAGKGAAFKFTLPVKGPPESRRG